MKKSLLALLLSLFTLSTYAQVDISYYLPEGYTYDESIPTPKEILGYEVGEWHVSHDQLVMYMKAVAEASDRVTFEETGRTYEKRPQVLLTITSPSNLGKIDQIKAERAKLRTPGASADLENMPVVMFMGYSVHGNEASGANASLLAAYHFAAANEIEAELEDIVLLLDPAINPDGLNRFASWVNSHKSYNMNGDPNNVEFNEAWPRGRTNHYWFDLNRDWLPVQHPESRNRVKVFQEWLPNIHLDFHEMGTNSTFFFQPGVPARMHPLTPEKNFELTAKIGTYHAKALDKIGSLYFNQENYDDYYYGKGSTYPDVQGSIGILFEQASSRGHLQESVNGMLSFPFTIRNQFTANLSSYEAAKEMRQELNTFMADFYDEIKNEVSSDPNKAYIFGNEQDDAKSFHLADLILQHDIKVFSLNEDITVNGTQFKSENSFIVPADQPQYRLIKAMFETRNTFKDSLFYDVSAWTYPMAFNLDYMALNSQILNLANTEEVTKDNLTLQPGQVIGNPGAYAYAMEWTDYYAPKAAYKLMEAGFLVRVATMEFGMDDKQFGRGTLLISKGESGLDDQAFYQKISEIAAASTVDIYALTSGNTTGINLGSPNITPLDKPEIALLVEGGVSSYEAGEIWHLMDQRYEIPITLLAMDRVSSSTLDRYNVLLMPDGRYSGLGKSGASSIQSWVARGGTLLAKGGAIEFLAQHDIGDFEFREIAASDSALQKNYADYDNARGAKVTGGAIFNAHLDLTHPIGYGYTKADIHTFRNDNLFLEPSKNPYANPLVYTDQPLASGYLHPSNVPGLQNGSVIQVAGVGRGRIVAFTDNMNFRAFWFGTNKLYTNAIFFGQVIQSGTTR
ncbi:M14 family metallopeptidase [Algoriphagus halophytocola]|uniref:M14 family metallopeptidase n=1 Tax=Algoriphagus halophytocola TaxID=2991499 RepID=A0ABY6MGA1_9BACT|nr:MULTISPECIES: M14 metallopeptidase family protein [unclassified Algoriphagus]UZD21661.1 M14 family metallopeptidase [Algoriphagus sp. TR-M5]WBL42873.1 M14 family metallopeptidase [Algoriphagus sp. TR-M9]